MPVVPEPSPSGALRCEWLAVLMRVGPLRWLCELAPQRGLFVVPTLAVCVCSALDLLDSLVARWSLQPHPEGGWYRELQRSSIQVTKPGGQQRSAITTVLFLLGAGDVSRWHCVHGGDEIWTFISGAPLSLFQHADGAVKSTEQMLSPANPVDWVSAGVWMAARSQGDYSLVSCCVGPGFSFEDFELLRDRPPSRHPAGIRLDLL